MANFINEEKTYSLIAVAETKIVNVLHLIIIRLPIIIGNFRPNILSYKLYDTIVVQWNDSRWICMRKIFGLMNTSIVPS